MNKFVFFRNAKPNWRKTMANLLFIGHSAFEVDIAGKKILIDPFITGNPQAVVKPGNLHPDYIILTHGHSDHLGDAIDIALRNKATIVAPFELAVYCSNKGAKTHPMHIGGSHLFDFGVIRFTLALHGSTIVEGDKFIPAGNPVGVIIEASGKRIYHAGDTGFFGDMKIIGKRFPLDVALLPIGGNFTMDIDDAIYATEMLKPKIVIPMHYNTFPLIEADPEEFAERVQPPTRAVILNPGEEFEF